MLARKVKGFFPVSDQSLLGWTHQLREKDQRWLQELQMNLEMQLVLGVGAGLGWAVLLLLDLNSGCSPSLLNPLVEKLHVHRA